MLGNNWFNILKTGNLLHEQGFLGDAVGDARVQAAIGYMEANWNVPNQGPGWRGVPGGPSDYHATFTAMKGLASFGIMALEVPPGSVTMIDWFNGPGEMADTIIAQQNANGSWPWTKWEQDPTLILSTAWALLTLERVAPPLEVVLDIKPQSCPNPFNPKDKGLVPMAIVGTEGFDVTTIVPELLVLRGPDGELTPPLKWSIEDTTQPPDGEEPCDCFEAPPPVYDDEGNLVWEYTGDGYLDLVFHFDAQEVLGILGGGLYFDQVIVLGIEGELENGIKIFGEDCIIIRGLKKKK